MAGTYMLGETKVRPGSYFNIQKKGDGPASGAKNGIVGVLFKSDWGPLNQAVEVSVDDGYENIFGTGGTTDAIGLAFEGGAITAICCRVGNGGTEGNVKLKLKGGETDAVSITAKYPGKKAFTVSVKDKLWDALNDKGCQIMNGLDVIEYTLKSGEKDKIIEAIDKLSGYDSNNLEEVAKNS